MTTLGDYLKAQGFTVDDSNVPYGREATWEKVKWLFVHHTAGSEASGSESGQASYIRTASGRYPPLAQLMLGQSSKVWVCSKQRSGQAEPGRASHAGEGIYPGIPRDSANQMSLGVEVHCSGAHPLSTHSTQYKTLIKLLASLCKRYGLNETKVIGHKEYSSTGKIDPKDSMNTIRKDVKAALAGGSSGGGNDGDEDGEMKHTVGVSDVAAPIVVKSGTQAFVSWRDIDEDDENFFGSVSFIPTRYSDFDTSGYLKMKGPCRVRVCRYSEDGSAYEASYTLLDVPSFADTVLPAPSSASVALAAEPVDGPLVSGAIDVNVGGNVTVTVKDETGDQDTGPEPEIFVSFGAQGSLKVKKRLRIRIDAIYGDVTILGGRWIIRYRDHIA